MLQASELADLEDDANMPLEQLLARYAGYANTPQAAGPSHTASPPHPTTTSPPGPMDDPSPAQTADNTHSPEIHSTQQTGQVQAGSAAKGKGVATMPGGPSTAYSGTPLGPPLGVPPSGSRGMTGSGSVEDLVEVKPEEQAEQAAAAGMDAFEHSQALAERRASGSQAGPSALSPPAAGKGACAMYPCLDWACTLTAPDFCTLIA